MAKKKMSEGQKARRQEPAKEFVGAQYELSPAVDSVCDADAAKLEVLRSLNMRLLNAEVSRRQQVESLLLSNESLEQELGLANSRVEGLNSDLAYKIIENEIEESVMSSYLASEMGEQSALIGNRMVILEAEARELKSLNELKERNIGRLDAKIDEIEKSLRNERNVSSKAIGEREGTRETLALKTEELEKLRQNLSVLEAENRDFLGKIEGLQMACDSATRSNKETEARIVSLTNERDSLKESLLEAAQLIEELKGEISNAVINKRRIEELRDVAVKRNEFLENVISERTEMVNELTRKGKELDASLAEMKKRCGESDIRFKKMETEINELEAEKRLAEDRAKKLSESKTAMEMDLQKAVEKLAKEEGKVGELVHDKGMLLEENFRLQREVGELRNHEVQQKTRVSKLEECHWADAELIKSLEREINDYKCKIEDLEFEKNDMITCLNGEKQKVLDLKKKINDLVAELEQRIQDAGEAEAARGVIFAEKEDLKGQLEALKMGLRSVEDMMNGARNETQSMKAKVELADARTEMILKMLKNTAAFCKRDVKDVHFQVNDEGVKPFAVEMESIVHFLRREERKTEEMGRELESLKTCVGRAQKRSSLWATFSSATSILAAFAFAFAAKRSAC